jgi:hypothetical protein
VLASADEKVTSGEELFRRDIRLNDEGMQVADKNRCELLEPGRGVWPDGVDAGVSVGWKCTYTV